MTTRRPTKIRVGWATFRVEYLDHTAWCANEDENLQGRCYPARQVLQIRTGNEDGPMHPQLIRSCLLHEVLHALFHTTGLSAHHGGVDSEYREEFIVSLLDGPLLGVLQENPALVKWLLEESSGEG